MVLNDFNSNQPISYLPLLHPTRHAHTSTHSPIYPSSPLAHALDHYQVSALRSRLGWISARNNEGMSEQCSS